MTEAVWNELIELADKLAPSLLTLLGVLLGWSLNARSQRKQLRLDRLEESFREFREVRTVVENLPSDLDQNALEARLSDDDFRKKISLRLLRLFGLRTELIPSLHRDFRDFIDKRFRPLFEIEAGSYTLRTDKLKEFAECCFDLRRITIRVEEELGKEYEKLWK